MGLTKGDESQKGRETRDISSFCFHVTRLMNADEVDKTGCESPRLYTGS